MNLGAPDSQDIILVGGTGDLGRKKLLPAIYNLHLDGLLPPDGHIIVYSREEMDDRGLAAVASEAIENYSRRPFAEAAFAAFCKRFVFVPASTGMGEVARRCSHPSRLVFFATPPSVFGGLARELAAEDLIDGTRLIVEKPFGRDLASSEELNATLYEYFDESQIFRVDHYLGKETVQNILAFRFGNSMFERVWNRDAIDHIQITVAEDIGVENRGPFYEEVGALRDIVQNHVLQVLAFLTMEPPPSMEAELVRDEKVKLLRSVRPIYPNAVVRAQYSAGTVGGKAVPGYREEPGVGSESTTETFIAARLEIDNWRWAGIPICLRAGKRLPRRVTEVHVRFRSAPKGLIAAAGSSEELENHLTLRIQPDESISFSFMAKTPGPEMRVEPVRMNFAYSGSFAAEPQEAYERLLHDAMIGDRTLFLREDTVAQAWRLIAPVQESMPPICFYQAGTWGPEQADDLLHPLEWHLH